MEDILLESNSTGSFNTNPISGNQQIIVGFEAGELGSATGTGQADKVATNISGNTWPGLITNLSHDRSWLGGNEFGVHNGWAGTLFGPGSPGDFYPNDLDNPFSGSQYAYMQGNGQQHPEDLTFDIDTSANVALHSLQVMPRSVGSLNARYDIELFEIGGGFLGAFSTPSAPLTPGQWHEIAVPAPWNTTPISGIFFRAAEDLGATQQFGLDHIVFNVIPEPTSVVLMALAGVALAGCRRRQG